MIHSEMCKKLRFDCTNKCYMQVIYNCEIVDFVVPADHRVRLKECEKRDKYLDLARELKLTMEHEGDSDPNCIWCARNNPQKELENLEIRRQAETIQTTALL